MKKIVSVLIVFVMCFALMLPVTVSAASASASLTGPGTVRAGDTITLSFNLKGSGIFGASGTLSYDSSQVTLSGTSQKIGSPWAVEFNGNNFVAYDNNLSNPINSSKTLFTVTFKVNSVAAGTNIKISYTGVTASDGSADASVGTVTYSTTVAAPLATDNNLASLTVSNATISPAFSAGTTSYTASVPFEISKLNVSATAADGKAKVSINSPTLTPNGTTKVTVTVTAENGAKKTYTISVKRAQDPNYKASGNNNLSAITVEGFLLSPGFNADTTQYVIWLPYETTSVKISGSAADSKASVVVVGGDTLVAGQDNPIKVICTAENGGKKEYTIIAKRAAAHDGSVEELPEDTTTPDATQPDDTTANTQMDDTAKTNNGVAWWWLIVVGIGALAIGAVGGFFGKEIIKKK
ncbi:MAG: cadherin-like beta sandwich domain-containing protein [Oscillospiraceae bacterium]|nr:cadherin-like beta sandwich domain-containing protein [Oscillospiraceae bacterium]